MVRTIAISFLLITQLLAFQPALAASLSPEAIFDFTNQARTQHDLAPISLSKELTEAANLKAQDMVAKGYFDHFAPDGTTPWHFMEQTGYVYQDGGENLAAGFTDAREAVDAWMNSTAHRQNVLDGQFKDMGVAVVPATIDGVPDFIIVQMFGNQLTGLTNDLTDVVNEMLGVEDGNAY